ncbi:FAD-dependent oxidoreductase [Thermosulfurimonas sp. F29]|uniref:FAD-dependent oxidoreductase n=1 Tax=Thermosulfurimonas sp. F29 TaxID=2867247 RepID=UPI001C82AD3D|nr:FAD-dependent oxidoreductase [Thermosulfurimonas sp. F29]MBX6423480.1 FAD-dependent oxidoreductase [Thermosulfurimonas sp. F29]
MRGDFSYDVVVVGGGPAGLSAAIVCARAGLSVILLERGRFSGAKNLFGGVVYTESILSLVPDLFSEKRLPFERPVTEEGWWILSENGVVKITHTEETRRTGPPRAYTAFRARFDPWLEGRAREAGVLVVPKVRVVDVLREGGRMSGVLVDRPRSWDRPEPAEVRAPVTIISEGVNRILTRKAGLVPRDFAPEEVALSVKEVIQLPKGEVEKRFGLSEEEGLAVELIGEATLGLPGSGFLYTNTTSVSLGVGLFLSDFAEKGIKPYELLENLKRHPVLSRLLSGGEILEYGAHLIPEWGFEGLPRLCGDGVMVVGDAAGLVNPLFREGTNLAIYSGIMAGKAAVFAHERGDFSRAALYLYEEAFRQSYIYRDLKYFRKLKRFLRENRHFFEIYPEILNQVLHLYLTAQGRAKEEVFREIFTLFRKKRGLAGLLRDFLRMGRFLRGW